MKLPILCKLTGHVFGDWVNESDSCTQTRKCKRGNHEEKRYLHKLSGMDITERGETRYPYVIDSSDMGYALGNLSQDITVYQECLLCGEKVVTETKTINPMDQNESNVSSPPPAPPQP